MATNPEANERPPIPFDELVRQLGLDRPRVPHPDDDRPTRPEPLRLLCWKCDGEGHYLKPIEEGTVYRSVDASCDRCGGTGVEP
jgi:hypothetical protein